ncbi:hypothetical protein DOTSEDRAFT_24583 [Dothistroma septosporum NZE10]|uniref:Uncharacterized protein n=1 Tax=Dothistroma septosporum (strain NZE10 / CBS 128990) TaxID=675120 RepID=N1PM44_DOTSN|nr:hypothetical protein DOTSEDRAFT_24583 [Dothistroma septosporum NZE10]
MLPLSNAAAVATVLSKIHADPGTIATRSRQMSFLKQVTSKHKFRYYSSIYGHTCHDEESLRSVLVAVMRRYGKAGEDIRLGKAPVDELLERGSEMLDDDYVKAVKKATEDVELELVGEGDGSAENSEIDQEMIDFIEAQTDSDDDYHPTIRARTRSAKKSRRVDDTRHDTGQALNTSYIDSWIEACSPSSSGSHYSTSDDIAHGVIFPSCSSATSAIVVAGSEKRRL